MDTEKNVRLLFDDTYLKKIEDRVNEDALRASSEGAKVVGVYCAFTPKELIAAAGAIPVALCSGAEGPIPAAEAHLPRTLCPLVKSSYGHALNDTCPYFHMTDLIIADVTCDGKKKMYELLSRLRPIYLLQLPQTSETEAANTYWVSELYRVGQFLEKKTGRKITDTALRSQIRLYNRLRETIVAVFSLNKGEGTPLLFGRELNAVTSIAGFEINIETRIREMQDAVRKARNRAESDEFRDHMTGRPRLLLTGCPNTNKKVLDLIEDSGATVVALENCGGLKTSIDAVSENNHLMDALARRYLRTACACMTPNNRRLEIIGNLIRDYRIEGVVDLTWEACHTYNVESFLVQETVTERFDRPYLHVRTDYSLHDTGQLRTRIEAFIEMLK